jgi:hypothetical protein
MTALDDLLNSSSLVMYPASISAVFAELEPGYASVATVTAAESIIQLGQQIGPQGATVTQSFDDGLPDPVTLTGNNDASGTFTMDLVGRPSAVASDASLGGQPNTTTGQGTGTTFSTTYPSGLAFWDYVIVAVTVSADTLVTETSMAEDSMFRWQLLGDTVDTLSGTFLRTFVFGRKHYTSGVIAPSFKLDTSANYNWIMVALKCGRTPSNNVLVPVTPGEAATFAEGTSAVSTHTLPNVDLEGRGWTIGVFAATNAAGAWTSSGNTIFAALNGTNISQSVVISPFRSFPGSYGMAADTAVATQLATGVHLAMEVRDRPQLDAAGYFSPLNKKSPIHGFERDTAAVLVSINNISTDGNRTETTDIFTGQMTGIDVTGRTANTQGISRTRLYLDGARQLPTVYGWREGLETDWLAGYLLANGGQYTGIAPSVYTRWWAPQHGSMHPYIDGSSCYTECREWQTGRTGSFRRSPDIVEGPFVTATFGQQTNDSTIYVSGIADRTWPTEVPGVSDPLLKDLLSQQSNTGRLSFWVRGDAADETPTCVDSGDTDDYLLFSANVWNQDRNGNLGQYVRVQINPNRNFTVWVGTAITLTGGDLPSDGQWHFCSFMWDYDAGTGKFRRDGLTWNTGVLGGGSETLPVSDQAVYDAGGYVGFGWRSHLPVAEIQLESGMPYTDDWSRFYPTPTAPSLNATYRASRQPLAVIAETTPTQGWSGLQSLAESTLSWMRCNEKDNTEFVTLDYFGESEQMEVGTLNVLDTDFNAGEINLGVDPSRTRNVVIVQFTETRVGSNVSPILEMNTSLEIPRGTTVFRFALDVPTAETHGAALYWTNTPEFQKLNANQIAGLQGIQIANVMSVNTLADGSGSVITSSNFTARIIDWTSNSIDVQFVNNTGGALYLANNGDQIPFLRALGYAISTNDGYAVSTDGGSVVRRRERALTTTLEWVHDRSTAQALASTLVSILSQPRPIIQVRVQGDPRRKPGQLCAVVDSTGTAVDGTWRITAIDHTYTGPQYTQDVTLIRVGTTGIWDQSDWDDAVWGS